MDDYEQWLRQLLSDLASFASARRATDQRRAMEMIEYSTAELRKMLDAACRSDRPSPGPQSNSSTMGACQLPRFAEFPELINLN